jgi:hypothetical protein
MLQLGNGKRRQMTRTYDKLKDARAELSQVRHETDRGTYVRWYSDEFGRLLRPRLAPHNVA